MLNLNIFRKSIISMIKHDGIEYAGYIAFLALLSIFPFTIFLTEAINFVSNAFGTNRKELTDLLSAMTDIFPENIVAGIRPRAIEIISGPSQTLITIAFVNIIWTSSSIIEGLRTILNVALRVKSTPPYPMRRLMSIVQFFILVIMIVFSLLLTTIFPSLQGVLSKYIEIKFNIYVISKILGSALFVSVLFLTYTFLPNVRPKFVPSIFATAFVLVSSYISTIALTIFMKHFSQLNIIYGSLGGIIISLMFFYVLALLFIFGAELMYYISKEFK